MRRPRSRRSRLRRWTAPEAFPILGCAIAIGVSTLALIGWSAGISPLASGAPGLTPMNPLSAFCLIALTLSIPISKLPRARSFTFLFCIPVILISSMRLLDALLGWPEQLSVLLFSHTDGRPLLNFSPMSIPTAFNLILAAVAILISLRGDSWSFAARWTILTAALLETLALFLESHRFPLAAAISHAAPTVPAVSFPSVVAFIGLAVGATTIAAPDRRANPAFAFQWKTTLAFTTALAILCAIGLVANRAHRQFTNAAAWDNHTQQVLLAISRVGNRMLRLQNADRGYELWPRPAYLDAADTAAQDIQTRLDELRMLVSDNPVQSQRVARLTPLISQFITQSRQKIPADDGQQLDQITDLLHDLSTEETRLLQNRTAQTRATSDQAATILNLGIGLACALVAVCGWRIHRDIAAREHAEQTSRKLNAALLYKSVQLDAVHRELEAFSYSISHDLRTPLRAVDGFSQALLEDHVHELHPKARVYLDRIRAGAQHMGQLIDEMLKLSRISRDEMKHETVDLSQIAHCILATLQKSHPDRHVQIVIAPDLRAEGDPRLLHLALENLLGNAWKFSAHNPDAKIEFGLVPDTHPTFFIRDNGAGFDMAYAEKLFGAFQRLHTTKEFPGDGIGLATVQRIVKRHGGHVWATSHVNRGATFYFTLPSGRAIRLAA